MSLPPPFNLQGAIDDVVRAGGGPLSAPKGDFRIEGITLPAGKPIEILALTSNSYGEDTHTTFHSEAPPGTDAITVLGGSHCLRGFRLVAYDWIDPPDRGVVLGSGQNEVHGVSCERMGFDGLYIDGEGRGAFANRVTAGRFAFNGRDGVAIHGGSGSLNKIADIDVRKNLRYGCHESGFLQNLWSNCHASTNGTFDPNYVPISGAGYAQTGVSNYSTFDTCYMEADQLPPIVESPNCLCDGGSLQFFWPRGRLRTGNRSLLTFEDGADEGTAKVTIPHDRAPMYMSSVGHDADWFQAFERYAGSIPWLKNTRPIIRHKSSPFAPFLITDERHPLGPGNAQYGSTTVPSIFRFATILPLETTRGGEFPVEVSHESLTDEWPGAPIISAHVMARETTAHPASVVRSYHAVPERKLIVWVKTKGPGEYDVHVKIERWHDG